MEEMLSLNIKLKKKKKKRCKTNAQFLNTQTSILMTQNSNKNSIQQAMKESLTHMLKIEDNQRN